MTQKSALDFSSVTDAGALQLLGNKSLPWSSFRRADCPLISLVICVLQALEAFPKPFIILTKGPRKRSPPLLAPPEATL